MSLILNITYMPNWGRFFRRGEYGDKDINFKADDSKEGIDIDKIPEKSAKQRVDDYRNQYGDKPAEAFVTTGKGPGKYYNEEYDVQHRKWEAERELDNEVAQAKFEEQQDPEAHYAKIGEKIAQDAEEKMRKEMEDTGWGGRGKDYRHRDIDHKRQKSRSKGEKPITPRDPGEAWEAGEKYNNIYEEK